MVKSVYVADQLHRSLRFPFHVHCVDCQVAVEDVSVKNNLICIEGRGHLRGLSSSSTIIIIISHRAPSTELK